MNQADLQKFNQAIQLAQNGQNGAAQNILAELVAQYPKDSNIWLWIAFTSSDPERARRAVERAAKLEPTNPNLAHASTWLEQQFPAATRVPQTLNVKATQPSSSGKVLPDKASRPKSLVNAFIVLLVLAFGVSGLLVAFVPQVRSFVTQSSAIIFNTNTVPAPGADLVTRLPTGGNSIGEMQAYSFVPISQPQATDPEKTKFGLFTLKTQNTSKILAYYAEKYPPKTANFTSFNTPTGAFLYQELPESKEHLLLFIIHNEKMLQERMQTQYQVTLQPDESVMLVLLTKENIDPPPNLSR